jgi:hypothetical protein
VVAGPRRFFLLLIKFRGKKKAEDHVIRGISKSETATRELQIVSSTDEKIVVTKVHKFILVVMLRLITSVWSNLFDMDHFRFLVGR